MYIINDINFKTKEAVDAFLLTATVVYADDCTSLTKLFAPKASKVRVNCCTALTELSAPKATQVSASSCTSLTKLFAPKATQVGVNCCTSLTELSAPMATDVYADACTSLTELSLPMATEVRVNYCTSLTELSLPMATEVSVSGCKSLTELSTPMAAHVRVSGCKSLTKCNGYEQLSEAECRANLKAAATLALASPDALDMGTVHACETTHCISGWAIFNNPNGEDMQNKCGWWVAGKFLLGAEAASHFMDSQKDGITYLQSVSNQGE
jgi:hypothetical protein